MIDEYAFEPADSKMTTSSVVRTADRRIVEQLELSMNSIFRVKELLNPAEHDVEDCALGIQFVLQCGDERSCMAWRVLFDLICPCALWSPCDWLKRRAIEREVNAGHPGRSFELPRDRFYKLNLSTNFIRDVEMKVVYILSVYRQEWVSPITFNQELRIESNRCFFLLGMQE